MSNTYLPVNYVAADKLSFYSKTMLAEESDILSKIYVNKRFISLLLVSLSVMATNVTANTKQTQCPREFYQVPLVSTANYCQLFADTLPASMSYHSTDSQTDSKSFYIDALGQPDQELTAKGRFVLSYKQGQQTIIISADKQGSQIDILVK